jgi:hypothetical protein
MASEEPTTQDNDVARMCPLHEYHFVSKTKSCPAACVPRKKHKTFSLAKNKLIISALGHKTLAKKNKFIKDRAPLYDIVRRVFEESEDTEKCYTIALEQIAAKKLEILEERKRNPIPNTPPLTSQESTEKVDEGQMTIQTRNAGKRKREVFDFNVSDESEELDDEIEDKRDSVYKDKVYKVKTRLKGNDTNVKRQYKKVRPNETRIAPPRLEFIAPTEPETVFEKLKRKEREIDADRILLTKDRMMWKEMSILSDETSLMEHQLAKKISKVKEQLTRLFAEMKEVKENGTNHVQVDQELLSQLQVHEQLLTDKLERYRVTHETFQELCKDDAVDVDILDQMVKNGEARVSETSKALYYNALQELKNGI